jgi:hypothetical protein
VVDFPKPRIQALQDVAVQLVDKRKVGSDLSSLARDLIAAFVDVCERWGLDNVLAELGEGDSFVEPLTAKLQAIDLDGGGPRQAKPKQIADCVVAALNLTLVEPVHSVVELGDDVRTAVAAAVKAVVDPALVPATLREAITAETRKQIKPIHMPFFSKLAAQLDDRGLQLIKPPKVPIDSLHAFQRTMVDARNTVISHIANTAIDRAKAAIPEDAAARIDQPITLKATPREVVTLRACNANKTPKDVTAAIVEGLAELAGFKWLAADVKVQPYSASKTFVVGDVIEHPKFGRGTVVATAGQRMDVEFADGKVTLVHAR